MQTKIMDYATIRAIEGVAARAAKDEIARQYDRDWFYRQFESWDLWNKINSRCDTRVQGMVPSLVNSSMRTYTQNELDTVLNRKMNVLFPQFIANEPSIKRHLDDHIHSISSLMDRKKEGIAIELDTIAKTTANKMAKDDRFGLIYDSIVSQAQTKISSEGLKVKDDVVRQMNEELRRTREEKKLLFADLKSTQKELSQSLSDQNKFKWIATGGFVTGVFSLVGVAVLANK